MFYMLVPADAPSFCDQLEPVWTIFGYIIFGIKIVVPLILIIYGMLDMTKAVMKKDEGEIKKAQSLLVKRLIAAVLVYLIITIVGIVVNLVYSEDSQWKTCVRCAFHPFDDCQVISEP